MVCPSVEPLDYVACWQDKDALRRVGNHTREDVEHELWPWLKQRGFADDGDDTVLLHFLDEFLGNRPAQMRPGLRFRRVWTFPEAAGLGSALAETIRSQFDAVFAVAHEPALRSARGSAVPGQLDWTREEIILAMDFYVTCGAIDGGPIPGQHTSKIAELSALLRTLSAYPLEVQGDRYRNTHGVYLKLMNLRAVQTGGAHGMNRFSQADAAVWRDYIDNRDALHAEAEAIRQRLAEGVLTPPSTAAPTMEDVPIEDRHTERFMTNPFREPREAERAEAALVHRYRDHLAAKGIAVSRKKYRAGQVRPMFCDLWVQDLHALIEAKNSDNREALRMAIGQLYDYRRFHEPPVRLAVLLSHPPHRDELALLQSAGIEAIWEYGTGFRDSANGIFV